MLSFNSNFDLNIPIPSPTKIVDAYKRWRLSRSKLIVKKVYLDYQTGLYRTLSHLPRKPQLHIPEITAIPVDVERPPNCTLPRAPPHRAPPDTNSQFDPSGTTFKKNLFMNPFPNSTPRAPQYGPQRAIYTSARRERVKLRRYGSWFFSRLFHYRRAYGAEYSAPCGGKAVQTIAWREGEEAPELNPPVTREILNARREFIRDAGDFRKEMQYQRRKIRELYEKYGTDSEKAMKDPEVQRRTRLLEILQINLDIEMRKEEEERRRERREEEERIMQEEALLVAERLAEAGRRMEKERVRAEQARAEEERKEKDRIEREQEVERMRQEARKMREEELERERAKKEAEEAGKKKGKKPKGARKQGGKKERQGGEKGKQAREKANEQEHSRDQEHERAQAEEEQARKRQEARDRNASDAPASDDNTRLRSQRSYNSKYTTSEDIRWYIDAYRRSWEALIRPESMPEVQVPPIISAQTLPWPILGKVKTYEDITHELVKGFIDQLCATVHDGEMVTHSAKKKVIRTELLKWHPDKFEGRMQGRIVEDEWAITRQCAEKICKWLNDMLADSE